MAEKISFRERKNPKNEKKTQYKGRFRFTENGIRKQGETSWFDSKEKARKEAENIIITKERDEVFNLASRRDKQLSTAFELYIEELEEKAENGGKKSNTARQLLTTAKAVKNKHLPDAIGRTKITNISKFEFRKWLNYANDKEEIGGQYIRDIKKVLLGFNSWLEANGYYTNSDNKDVFELTIKNVKLKPTRENNREDEKKRNVIDADEVNAIGRYYIDKNIGKFRNYYYYTLFYTLFFSGLRMEELTALQWKHIKSINGKRPTMEIKNAISLAEDEDKALERVRKEEYRTKNKGSVRVIHIFSFYSQLLDDYKESYRYEYKLTEEEMGDCFVFPRLSQKQVVKTPNLYLNRRTVLKELDRACAKIGLPKTDCQMFRHSCATFLIMPKEEGGMGFKEEEVYKYFGHSDTEMLKLVYARLDERRQEARQRTTFVEAGIYEDIEVEEEIAEQKKKETFLEKFKHNQKSQAYARYMRVLSQIEEVEKHNGVKYEYSAKDRRAVNDYIKKRNKENEELVKSGKKPKELKMEFVEV